MFQLRQQRPFLAGVSERKDKSRAKERKDQRIG
jgi:hypothetical protein